MIYIFGGGTVTYVRNHLALCAPAYGGTARKLYDKCRQNTPEVGLLLTKMADPGSSLESNEDVQQALCRVLRDPKATHIIFNVALCDYHGHIPGAVSGKYSQRLSTREGDLGMQLFPAPKLLPLAKDQRPDVGLAGFKNHRRCYG